MPCDRGPVGVLRKYIVHPPVWQEGNPLQSQKNSVQGRNRASSSPTFASRDPEQVQPHGRSEAF